MNDIRGVTTRRTRTGVLVGRIHYSADPERDAEWVRRERAKYSSQAAWDREQEIVHTAGGGELMFRDVLNDWGHKIIISEPGFCVSPFWNPIGGFDQGKTNPTAALLAAVDGDGTIYILAEYYQPGLGLMTTSPTCETYAGAIHPPT